MRITRIEIAATAVGFDVAELRANQYQPGRTAGIPVWTIGEDFVVVVTDRELERLKAAGFDGYKWTPSRDAFAQSLAQQMKPARTLYFGKATTERTEREAIARGRRMRAQIPEMPARGPDGMTDAQRAVADDLRRRPFGRQS